MSLPTFDWQLASPYFFRSSLNTGGMYSEQTCLTWSLAGYHLPYSLQVFIIYLGMFIKGSNCFGWVLNQRSVCLYIAYIWEGNRYSALFTLSCVQAKANIWTQLFITAHCHNLIPALFNMWRQGQPYYWQSKLMCKFHLFSSAFLLFFFFFSHLSSSWFSAQV